MPAKQRTGDQYADFVGCPIVFRTKNFRIVVGWPAVHILNAQSSVKMHAEQRADGIRVSGKRGLAPNQRMNQVRKTKRVFLRYSSDILSDKGCISEHF